MRLNYKILDVFTRQPLAGNPLAVVFGADDLADELMQSITREFNLSETIFIQRPKSEGHDAAVRIFTPTVELPFAGHPTIGAAVALGLERGIDTVRLEEKVGVVTCFVQGGAGNIGSARFGLPRLPEVVGTAPGEEAIAASLGLDPADIGCGRYAPAVYSAGVPFYLVPVRDAGVLRRITPNRAGWEQTYTIGRGSVYAFTETPDEVDNDVAARMFSPRMGIGEDPATGSAAAALIGLIASLREDGQHQVRLRQGHEMNRPSLILLHLQKTDGQLVDGAIGGNAVIVAEGALDI